MSWSQKVLFDTLRENLDRESFNVALQLRSWLLARGGRYRRGIARTPSGRYGMPVTDDYPTLIGFYTWDPDYGRNDRIAIGFMNLASRIDQHRMQRFKDDLMAHEAFVPKVKEIHPPFNRYREFDIDGVLNAPGALETLQTAIDRLLRQ